MIYLNTNLILYDVEKFIDKYTRFMTKNIYISHDLYTQFLSCYEYLYQELTDKKFLYCENEQYQKVMDIKENKDKLVKLHNQKYLKYALKKYSSFFEQIDSTQKLDVTRRSIILTEEKSLLVIQPKNIPDLVVGKIKYLTKISKKNEEKICVLATKEIKDLLLQEVQTKNQLQTKVMTIQEFGQSLLEKNQKILEKDQLFTIIANYLMFDLFLRKNDFNSLYQAFKPYIYLNKDYQDFDTFKDYHNYMYKRKYLMTGLSIKKYNEQEIKKRKSCLRTIQNETMPTKEEVDIANFLYLNSNPYQYNAKDSVFILRNNQKQLTIRYQKEKTSQALFQPLAEDQLILYKTYLDGSTYLEKLAYELIKRRYPLDLRSEEEVYKELKDTTITSYFSEWLTNCLIPSLSYYDQVKNFDQTNLTPTQSQEIQKIYHYYKQYLQAHHLVPESELLTIIDQKLSTLNYQYLIIVGDIPLSPSIPYLKITKDYTQLELLHDNVKLLYEYKKYINQKKSLPILNTFQNDLELGSLTTQFLKTNLTDINQKLQSQTKEINLYLYDDQNRLRIYKNIAYQCEKAVSSHKKLDLLIALNHPKEINLLISNSTYSKLNKNILITQEQKEICYEKLLTISKNYDYILLPYLIPDRYHQDILQKETTSPIKGMVYIALTRSKKGIDLLCPISRKSEILHVLEGLKNIKIYD